MNIVLLWFLVVLIADVSGLLPVPTKTTVNKIGKGFEDLWNDNFDEILDKQLKVQGIVPSYIDGILLRNGPGAFGSKDAKNYPRRYTHAFDGLAKLHKYDISSNGIKFSMKFLRSKWHEAMIENQSDIPPSITTGPTSPEFNSKENLIAALTSSTLFDNVPVNLARLGGKHGKHIATTDAPVILEFDPKTLETIGKVSYKNSITSINGIELFSTAHPIVVDDVTFNYFLELQIPLPFVNTGNKVHIVSTDISTNREIKFTYDIGDKVPYVHSFGMTNRYVILTLWPLFMNPANSVNGKGFLSQLEWKPQEMSKILIFDLKGSASQKPMVYDASPLFAYHHINAYEENDNIIFDVTGYDTPEIINGPNGFAYLPNMFDEKNRKTQARDGNTYRFTIPTKSKYSNNEIIQPQKLETIDNDGQHYSNELLVINENFRRKKYRYTYGFTGFAGENSDYNYLEWAIIKTDNIKAAEGNKEASVLCWREENCYPNECSFINDPSAKDNEEDKGTLLCQVYDGNRGESFLLGLDASTMKEVFR